MQLVLQALNAEQIVISNIKSFIGDKGTIIITTHIEEFNDDEMSKKLKDCEIDFVLSEEKYTSKLGISLESINFFTLV